MIFGDGILSSLGGTERGEVFMDGSLRGVAEDGLEVGRLAKSVLVVVGFGVIFFLIENRMFFHY